MTGDAAALLADVTAAGARLEARLWCDAPDRLPPALRDALAQERPAVLRLLLDGQVGEGRAAATHDNAAGDNAALLPALPHPNNDAQHQARLGGYRRAAHRRPPSLPMNATPGAGCYCTCCAGQVWWCECEQPQGWRCLTCYAPDHLPTEDVRELRT